MADRIRPTTSKLRYSDIKKDPQIRKNLVINDEKRKSNVPMSIPIDLVKKTSSSSNRSPKMIKPQNIFGQDTQKYPKNYIKSLKIASKQSSSRRASPIRLSIKQNPFLITSKPGHRRNKSDVPTVTEKITSSPYVSREKLRNFDKSNQIKIFIMPEPTLKNKRNLSQETSSLKRQSSFIKSLNNSFETHETSSEDNKRQFLIHSIILNFRKIGLPLKTNREFYTIIKQIGKGSFGKVYLAIHVLTGHNVAIKAISKGQIQDERIRHKVFQEVFVMKRIHHRNVIRLLELFESENHIMIVLEFVDGGDLLQLVKSKVSLSETESKLIFSQIVQGVIAIHGKNVIHRDIKLDNVLMSADCMTAKICDFGVSRVAKSGQIIDEQCGTPAYLAPEIIVDRGYEPFYVDL